MWSNRLKIYLFFFIVLHQVFAYPSTNTPFEQKLINLLEEENYQGVIDQIEGLKSTDGLNMSKIHKFKADALYYMNDVPGALFNYIRAIDHLSSHRLDTVFLLEVYSHSGFCHKYLGNYVAAIPYYERALEIAKADMDSLEIANQLYNLGTIYLELGGHDQSKQHLEQAYKLDLARSDTAAIGYDLSSLGDLMMKSKNYPEAIMYYRQASRIKETLAKNINTESLRYGKLSQAFFLNKQIDSAKAYLSRAIQISEKQNDSLSLAKHKITQTEIFLSDGRTSEALRMSREVYDYFKKLGAAKFQIAAGEVLVQVQMAQRNFDQAIVILDDLIKLSKQNSLLEDLSQCYLIKSMVYEKSGNSSDALTAYKMYQVYKDSLNAINQTNTALLLEKEYQTAQKENQIALLTAQDQISKLELSQKQRTILFLAIALFLILVIGTYAFLTQKKKTRLKNQLLTVEINELRLQIKQLMDFKPEESSISLDDLNQALNEPLSEREFEVLQMAMTDKNNGEIAEEIHVSTNTVKYHLKNIYSKLGVSNRKEALKFAFQATSNNQ